MYHLIDIYFKYKAVFFITSLWKEKILSKTGIYYIFPTEICFKCNRFGAKSLPFKCSPSLFLSLPSQSFSFLLSLSHSLPARCGSLSRRCFVSNLIWFNTRNTLERAFPFSAFPLLPATVAVEIVCALRRRQVELDDARIEARREFCLR